MARPTLHEQNIRDSIKRKTTLIEKMYRKAEIYLDSIHKSQVIEARQLLNHTKSLEDEVKKLEAELDEIMNPKLVEEEPVVEEKKIDVSSGAGIFKKTKPTVIDDIPEKEKKNTPVDESVRNVFRPMKIDGEKLRPLTDKEYLQKERDLTKADDPGKGIKVDEPSIRIRRRKIRQ